MSPARRRGLTGWVARRGGADCTLSMPLDRLWRSVLITSVIIPGLGVVYARPCNQLLDGGSNGCC